MVVNWTLAFLAVASAISSVIFFATFFEPYLPTLETKTFPPLANVPKGTRNPAAWPIPSPHIPALVWPDSSPIIVSARLLLLSSVAHLKALNVALSKAPHINLPKNSLAVPDSLGWGGLGTPAKASVLGISGISSNHLCSVGKSNSPKETVGVVTFCVVDLSFSWTVLPNNGNPIVSPYKEV